MKQMCQFLTHTCIFRNPTNFKGAIENYTQNVHMTMVLYK